MTTPQVGSSPAESTSSGPVVATSETTPSATPSTGTITDLFDALSASSAKKTTPSKGKGRPVNPGAETPIEPIIIDDDTPIDELPIAMTMSGESGESGESGGTATIFFSGGSSAHEPGVDGEVEIGRYNTDVSSSLLVKFAVDPNATGAASLSDYTLEWQESASGGRSSVSINANEFTVSFAENENYGKLFIIPTDDTEVEPVEKVVLSVVDDTTTTPPIYVGDEYTGSAEYDIMTMCLRLNGKPTAAVVRSTIIQMTAAENVSFRRRRRRAIPARRFSG